MSKLDASIAPGFLIGFCGAGVDQAAITLIAHSDTNCNGIKNQVIFVAVQLVFSLAGMRCFSFGRAGY